MRFANSSPIWFAVPFRSTSEGKERGSVTAEFAAVAPALVIAIALCVGAIQAVTLQLRLTDAAADAARRIGRGDAVEATLDRPADALGVPVSARVDRQGAFVCAELSAPCNDGPFRLVGLAITVRSCALDGGA